MADLVAHDFSFKVPVKVGAPVSAGILKFANTATAPIRIVDVTLDHGSGLKFLGAKVLPLRKKDDAVMGVLGAFPPGKAVAGATEAVGAQLQPSSAVPAYELVLGLTVMKGPGVAEPPVKQLRREPIGKVTVAYEVDGQRHQAEFQPGVTLCAGFKKISAC